MMRTSTRSLLLIALVAGAASTAHAKDDACGGLHERVRRIYDFIPAKSDAALRTKKSKEMDVFWKWVEATPAAVLCLPAELTRADANAFFLFDGATLLDKSSTRPADKQAAAAAVARADLESVDPYEYLRFGRKLACAGADTSGIAKTLLGRASFDVDAFREPHLIKLSRRDALLFLLAPLTPAQYRPAFTRWLTERTFPAAQGELIEVAAYLLDSDLQQVLAGLAAQKNLSDEERKQLTTLLDLEKKTGRKTKLTRAEYQARVEKARRELHLEVESDDELRDLKEQVDAADLPLLKETGRNILCNSSLNQHAVENYALVGQLLQVALSVQAKKH